MGIKFDTKLNHRVVKEQVAAATCLAERKVAYSTEVLALEDAKRSVTSFAVSHCLSRGTGSHLMLSRLGRQVV